MWKGSFQSSSEMLWAIWDMGEEESERIRQIIAAYCCVKISLVLDEEKMSEILTRETRHIVFIMVYTITLMTLTV